jgi:hypothetical protein
MVSAKAVEGDGVDPWKKPVVVVQLTPCFPTANPRSLGHLFGQIESCPLGNEELRRLMKALEIGLTEGVRRQSSGLWLLAGLGHTMHSAIGGPFSNPNLSYDLGTDAPGPNGSEGQTR